MADTKYIIMGTYNGSGSSAVVDILKEFKDIYECDSEIRIVTDPYGIIQLERALVDDWDWIASTAAISDYLELCKKCARKKSRFPLARYGLGYSYSINPEFESITEDFIGKLTQYTYAGDFYHYKSKKPYYKYVIDRCLFGIDFYTKGKTNLYNDKIKPKCYFAKPSREQFYNAVQEYFDNLFSPFFQKNVSHIVLDQALTPNESTKLNKYFNNAKMIIVERDPRDIFANGSNGANRPNMKETDDPNAYANMFVMTQLAMRERTEYNENVLRIQFEDLVFHYDKSVSEIASFLNIDKSDHIAPKKYFKPEISRKNIGIWKHFYESSTSYKNALCIIQEKMPDYLYQL